MLVLNTAFFNNNYTSSKKTGESNIQQPKAMLEKWCEMSSPLLSKNILEYFRMIYRNEYFFHDWCLPLLLDFAASHNNR